MKLQVNLEMKLKINKKTTMKKLLFSTFFLCFVTLAFAQDLKTAKSDLDKKQLDKAKADIDAYVAKSPNDAEGLYMKAKIYEQIAASDQYKNLVTGDARQEALDAFKKAMADPKDSKMTLLALKDQYQPVFSLYTGYYEAAA